MRRRLYEADHEAFRQSVKEFVSREVTPHVASWDEARLIDREVWLAAGRQGILGLLAPAEFGGAGTTDYRYRNVVQEELGQAFATALASGFSLQDDIAIPYVSQLGDDQQRRRWLPAMCSGESIGALALTEPGTGSDLRAIRTAAVHVNGGWVVHGTKTFITNGIHSDIIITAVRTDPLGGSRGFSLLVIERGMSGFSRGRKLNKVGLHAQDTAELIFEDVFVPDENVLGTVGEGLAQLVDNLPLERLSIAAHAIAVADAIFANTLDYTQQRTAFGQAIADFQNTRFELAELATELDVTRAFVDKAILAYSDGDLTVVDAAKVKWWASDVQNRVVDRCLQLHGGYGYMMEYPVARAYQDARIQRIFGGTNEIMKEIIGRDLVGRR